MNGKVRFGIIGTGRISDWVLKGAVLEPRFEAAAVCSRSLERAKAFASSHFIPKVYSDPEEMASDPDIDAIYIGTPNHTHRDLAILCMRKGKHVLCEKPLASNAREVEEMIAVAREEGVVLMEAMISTLNPNFLNVQERLPEIGQVRHYSAVFCQYSSKFGQVLRILSGEDSSPVPSSFNPDSSGGALMDVGIYTIYPMVALFGRPDSVKAETKTLMVPAEGTAKPVDIQGNVLFGYPGFTASVMYSKVADSRLRTEISGGNGIISMDQIHIQRQVGLTLRGEPNSGRSSGPDTIDITVPQDADEYLCEFREFIDVVNSGRKESRNNSLSNSLITAGIMDEIRRQAGITFPADGSYRLSSQACI